MEEKESPIISGSPENTDSGSPTPISFSGGSIPATPSDQPSHGGPFFGGKRRGRPRKYDLNGNLSHSYTTSVAKKAKAAVPIVVSPPPETSFTAAAAAIVSPSSTTSYEFVGSNSSLGEICADTAGAEFTPHIITVQTGEDVAAKIHALGDKAPQGICVLSATGTISNVTIRQPGSGGLLAYEGQFQILSLSGSYTVSEAGGVKSRIGGLSITLANSDGHVVGGSVAGWIIAANPIQVVVGSFVLNGHKQQKRKYRRKSPTPMTSAYPDTAAAAAATETPNQQSMFNFREAGPPAISPVPAHSHSEADHGIHRGHNLNVASSHGASEWNNRSEPHRLYPDINVSVPGA